MRLLQPCPRRRSVRWRAVLVLPGVAMLVPLGGMLAYRLACETTIFAAIGTVSATMLGPCPLPLPVSVIHIHGTADRTIPYAGGMGKRDNGGAGARPAKVDGPPVPTLISTWRGIDHCARPSVSTAGPVATSVATR